MKKFTLLLSLFVSSITVFAVPSASAPISNKVNITINAKDCSEQTPCYVIKSSASVLSQAVNQNYSDKQAYDMIQNSIIPQIDFVLVSRLVMGQNWKVATPDQQTQITTLFKEMLVYSYTSAVSKFKGAQVTIGSSNISPDNPRKSAVDSTITLPSNGNSNNQPINVEYDLAKIGNNWKIYDVKIENASIVTTYRSQFNEIVQNNGVSGLIAQLQTKVNKLKANKAQ
jgi:phospholipid transport system substrate-binding protein